ncbi:hypothetical protein QVD17_15240 [Tagetes erecta]|uniref:Mediator of RNA polymerase II transcription subunit 21 n=1 Tax=Tagetes erecta TaxID=13708 RepID=A0AAD8KPK7_TARER|nr:hypothetical protein QVD17_15240 [Tagetes erecta]
MDIISQLQEQVNTIAAIAFNTFGTLQRDAPPVRLSPNYPEPPAPTTASAPASTATATTATATNTAAATTTAEESPSNNIAETPKLLSAELVKAAKQVDCFVMD